MISEILGLPIFFVYPFLPTLQLAKLREELNKDKTLRDSSQLRTQLRQESKISLTRRSFHEKLFFFRARFLAILNAAGGEVQETEKQIFKSGEKSKKFKLRRNNRSLSFACKVRRAREQTSRRLSWTFLKTLISERLFDKIWETEGRQVWTLDLPKDFDINLKKIYTIIESSNTVC